MKKLALLLLCCVCLTGGCLEQKLTVTSEPEGALVIISDKEIGRTPLTTDFTWYGDYRVRLEMPAYETLTTNRQVAVPSYQWPVLDFICEILLPFKFHDHHDWNFTMAPRRQVPPDELIDQAQEFRQEAQPPAE